MRIRVGDGWLYFDVDGAELVPDGPTMRRRPTVILLHGGPGADHSLFKPEFGALARHAQVVYLDQRGSGRSDAGRPEQWMWEPWADDVIAFCDALDIADPVLVGTSSGGWVALTAAIRHPHRVGRLVLDSVMPSPTDERLAVMERLGGPQARRIAERYWAGEDCEEVRRDWERVCLPLYSRRGDGGEQMRLRLARIRWNHDVLEHFRRTAAARFDPWGQLGKVRCPTLILAGEHDPVATAATARRLAAALPAATTRLEVFPDAGHGVFREAPERALAVLTEFLAAT